MRKANNYDKFIYFVIGLLILTKTVYNSPLIDLTAFLALFVLLAFSKKSIIQKIIVLFVFSILCTEKVVISSINLRIDDLLAVAMVGILFNRIFKEKLKISNVGIIIFGYLMYTCLIFLVNSLFRTGQLKYIFIIIKEFQYIVYFVFFKIILEYEEDRNCLFDSIAWCSILNCIYGFYSILMGIISYYGISCLASVAPAHSGGVFLMISFINFYIFSKNKKRINFYLFLSSALLTLCTISRTSIIGLLVIILLFLKEKIQNKIISKKSVFFVIAIFIILVLTAFYFRNSVYFSEIIRRFSTFSVSTNIRVEKWLMQWNKSTFIGKVFGNGVGFPEIIKNTGFTLATDNWYICLILEKGIIGLIIWFMMIFLLPLSKNIKAEEKKFIIILIVSYIIMGVTLEIFQTSLQASLFWLTIGLLTANIRNNLEEKKEE